MVAAICLVSRVKLNNTSSMKISMCKSKVYIEVRKIAPTRKHSGYNCSSVLRRRLYKGRHSFTELIPQELQRLI